MIIRTSKAQTLKQVKDKISLFEVPEFMEFKTNVFTDSPEETIIKIKERFHNCPLIIRSSAADEDGLNCARAGEYDSVLNVSSSDENELITAINKVITSYARSDNNNLEDEIIVQKYLNETSMSGVVFTHDLNTGAPYYVINYDDVSGMTDTVTSGGGEYANRTLYIHRGATESIRSQRFNILIEAILELEKVMDSQFLDIEFALGTNLKPYLLQVRAITTQPNWNRAVAKRIDSTLHGIQTFIKTRLQPMAGVYGVTTVLGQMPDWNPAEMIGRAPRKLAFSLYKTLITDNSWRVARKIMGYAVPHGQPLMISLAGQPFIDTRLSFHSYLPKGLEHETSEKLVNAWINKLRLNPELHDKVEFNVAITTFSFDIDDKLNELVEAGIEKKNLKIYKELLRQQTLELLTGNGESSISNALEKVKILSDKQKNLRKPQKDVDITQLFEMIEDCVQYGTIPFSILARHGFIAQTLLQSLKNVGILTDEEVRAIQSSIRTVASDLVNDMHRIQTGELSRSVFMERYGHLRPGTYDILSSRYDQMSEIAKKKNFQTHDGSHQNKYKIGKDKISSIDEILEDEGFANFKANDLLNYIREATRAREYGKFVFTRSVSNILELIADYGESHGLSREEMSHITVNNLLEIATTSIDEGIEERLRKISQEEVEKHVVSSAIRLPQVLFDEAGVHIVPFQVSHPNYITQKKITAPCVKLSIGQESPVLEGKIVLIENADPGFDWIFSQKIGGLITKYGGANSHMAIRCAEFGIPAAIGCGEQRYENIMNSDQILLDCAAGLITPLH